MSALTTPLNRFSHSFARPPRIAALRIALLYALVGALWIIFSDAVVERLIGHEAARQVHIQTIKGCFFILVTAIILYYLIRYTVSAVQGSERALKETEARTRLLVERVRDYAIFMLDAGGNVTSWNRGAQQIMDWTDKEILGKHVSVFYSKGDNETAKPQRDLHAAAIDGWSEEEAPLVRQDGSTFWANSQFTALYDETGKINGYLAVIRDVTERRRAQDALKLSNATMSSMLEALPLPVQAVDGEGKVRAWNPASQKVFGWTLTEVLGQPLPTIPPDQRSDFDQIIERQFHGERASGVEVIRQRRDGTRLHLNLWTAPLLNAKGEIVGSLGIFADLTERKRSEEQVRQLADTLDKRVKERTARLEEANEELQAFSHTISHDLQIPLRSLQQLARDLIEHHGQALDEEGHTEALRIVGAAARMERQIEDLLEYSRVSRSELKTEPLSLILIIHELLGRLERDPTFKSAEIFVQEPLGWVMGHRLTLQQVILNVLINAITFVAPGVRPAVRISAKDCGAMLRLCIGDNGIGIGEGDRQRVFQLFERLPAAERYPGIGVGLAVVRRGVERMGGRVEIQSPPGGGTLFCIDLPKTPTGRARTTGEAKP